MTELSRSLTEQIRAIEQWKEHERQGQPYARLDPPEDMQGPLEERLDPPDGRQDTRIKGRELRMEDRTRRETLHGGSCSWKLVAEG